MSPDTAIILAAGYGSRLQADESHKLLVTIGQKTLLDHHATHFGALGVRRLVVVTGYRSRRLVDAINAYEPPASMTVECAHNPDFDAGNGLSVLAGARAIENGATVPAFWLTMSDHLYEPALFDDAVASLDARRDPSWAGALFVDRKLDTIFDMPDATKICFDDSFAIGKQLDDFQAVDTGLFWCTEAFVTKLRAAKKKRGDCSTSDAVKALYETGRFGFVDIGDHLWQDVDTPGARRHASHLWRDKFDIPEGFQPATD